MVPSIPLPTALSGNNGHMIYFFNQNGVCLLYREWNRPLDDSNQDHKLMFGLLFSLKSLTAKMDPSSAEKGNLGVPRIPGQGCSFHSFHTNTYKLSFMESPSGIKMVLFMSTIVTQCTLKEVGVVHISVQLVIPEVTVTNSFQHLKQHYQIILVTHPKASDLRESLKYIYNLYAEYVVKNPLYTQGTPIKIDSFNMTLDQYVRGLG